MFLIKDCSTLSMFTPSMTRLKIRSSSDKRTTCQRSSYDLWPEKCDSETTSYDLFADFPGFHDLVSALSVPREALQVFPGQIFAESLDETVSLRFRCASPKRAKRSARNKLRRGELQKHLFKLP